MSTDLSTLQADLRRAMRRLTAVEPHLADLWSLAYEQGSGGDGLSVATSDTPDLSSVGDPAMRDALDDLARALVGADRAVHALARRLALHETSGSDDPTLRGTTINPKEWREATRAQQRRTARGETPARVVAQPNHPGGKG